MKLTECPCGSKEWPWIAYDARNIPLGYMCDKCEKRKLAAFRPEVLTDPNYDAPDLGDDEDFCDG
jgi:hypothetical protein